MKTVFVTVLTGAAFVVPCGPSEEVRIVAGSVVLNGTADGDSVSFRYQRPQAAFFMLLPSQPMAAACAGITAAIGVEGVHLVETAPGSGINAPMPLQSLALPDVWFQFEIAVSWQTIAVITFGSASLTYQVRERRLNH